MAVIFPFLPTAAFAAVGNIFMCRRTQMLFVAVEYLYTNLTAPLFWSIFPTRARILRFLFLFRSIHCTTVRAEWLLLSSGYQYCRGRHIESCSIIKIYFMSRCSSSQVFGRHGCFLIKFSQTFAILVKTLLVVNKLDIRHLARYSNQFGTLFQELRDEIYDSSQIPFHDCSYNLDQHSPFIDPHPSRVVVSCKLWVLSSCKLYTRSETVNSGVHSGIYSVAMLQYKMGRTTGWDNR